MSYQGWKRKATNYITPKNVKYFKGAVDTGRTAVNKIKDIQRKYKKVRKQKTPFTRRPVWKGRPKNTGPDEGIQRSHQFLVLHKYPKYKKGRSYTSYFNTFEQADKFSFASSTGTVPGTNQLNRQKVFELQSFGTCAGLKILAQNPYINAVAGFIALDPQLQSTTLNGKMLYGGITGAFEFTNQEQGNLIVHIYMCVARKNMESYTAPDVAWEAALDENAGPVRGATNVGNYMPDGSPKGKYFTDRWRIAAKKQIVMAAGITQRHTFSHTVNKEIDLSTLYSYAAIKDVTISFLVTMRGCPVDFDLVQTHGPATLVGYAPSKIVGITTTKYKYKTCTAEPPRIMFQNNALSGTAPAAVWDLNDEDGKPVNVFAATNAA